MQIFPRSLNKLPLVAAVGGGLTLVGIVFAIWYWWSPKFLVTGYAPTQPVPYSHRLHVGRLGMDCRYCHANIEVAAKAMIPPTQICMGCHAVVKTESQRLAVVRDSWEKNVPIEWVQVHRLPGHVYFDHSAHLAAGVGCVTCHGRIDQMEVVRVEAPMSMGWCLECHRDPTPNLRPTSEITNMEWKPDPAHPFEPPHVNPPQQCSGCHR